jgi:hypothetical protein
VTIAALPGLVVGVLAVGTVAGVDGEHFDPSFSEVLLSSPNWSKKPGLKNPATVQ